MKICSGWENFMAEVFAMNKQIVCFGAGMMGLYIEPLFIKEGLWEHIDCFLDNDENKYGGTIGRRVGKPIKPLKHFLMRDKKNILILITCVTYIPIVEQLDREKELDEIHCYIYPQLNRELVMKAGRKIIPSENGEEKIPRIIHYCWFGKNRKNALIKRCIDSWKKICFDYQVVEWNETNYDITKIKYMRQAYEEGKWAYVSDYARMDILYTHGGIYLDTDVEILKKPDILLKQEAFIAQGEWPAVNSGAGIGCVKGHPTIKEMRDEPRGRCSFFNPDGTYNMVQNGIYESEILSRYGYSYDFHMQYAGGLLVLSPEYLATSSILGAKTYLTKNTIALHHNEESWAGAKRKNERKQTRIAAGYGRRYGNR